MSEKLKTLENKPDTQENRETVEYGRERVKLIAELHKCQVDL